MTNFKCITMKTLLTTLFIIVISTILIIALIFYLYNNYFKHVESDENIDYEEDFDNEIILENEIISDEKDYIKLLEEKYTEKKIIALTFDDGPSKYTNDLIDELNKRNINVTFFVLGENIKKYPDSLKFAIDCGNEIGIHSYKHQLFTKLTRKSNKRTNIIN